MARKTSAVGIRLGEARWWGTRTPPIEAGVIGRQVEMETIKKLVRGVLRKYGVLLGEVMIGEAGSRTVVKVTGGGFKTWQVGEYALRYLGEIIGRYVGRVVQISYREEEVMSAGHIAESLRASPRGLVVSARTIGKQVQGGVRGPVSIGAKSSTTVARGPSPRALKPGYKPSLVTLIK